MFVDICWLYTPSNPQSQSLWIYLGLGSAIPLSDYVTIVKVKGFYPEQSNLLPIKLLPTAPKYRSTMGPSRSLLSNSVQLGWFLDGLSFATQVLLQLPWDGRVSCNSEAYLYIYTHWYCAYYIYIHTGIVRVHMYIYIWDSVYIYILYISCIYLYIYLLIYLFLSLLCIYIYICIYRMYI
jgi:hypothetical protein